MKAIRFFVALLILIGWCNQSVSADIVTLDDLVNGATLTSGGTTYSNFEYLADDGSISPDISLIDVSAVAGGIEFSSDSEFALPVGFETVAIQIGFEIDTTGPGFRNGGTDLSFGNPQAGNTGLIDLLVDFSDGNDMGIGFANSFVDPFVDETQLTDITSFAQTSQLRTVTSFTLFADTSESVSIGSFRVTTSVPEPTSGIVMGLAGICFLVRRRR